MRSIAVIALGTILLGTFFQCGPLVLTAPTTHSPERWEIIPTLVEVSPAQGGWQRVRIEIALENRTHQFSAPQISTEGTTLITEEGYSYAVNTMVDMSYRLYPVTEIAFREPLPPGFRQRGMYDDDHMGSYEFKSSIAEDTHPKALHIPAYGDIDLTDLSPVSFPGGDTYSPVRNAGETVQIPNKARLTVVDFGKETGDRVTATLKLENLSEGYGTTLHISFRVIGDDGLVSRLHGRQCWPTLTIGPAQTIDTTACFIMPRGSTDVFMILSGDIDEVYDTGY